MNEKERNCCGKISIYSKRYDKELVINNFQKCSMKSNEEIVLGWCNSGWSKHGGWSKPVRW